MFTGPVLAGPAFCCQTTATQSGWAMQAERACARVAKSEQFAEQALVVVWGNGVAANLEAIAPAVCVTTDCAVFWYDISAMPDTRRRVL